MLIRQTLLYLPAQLIGPLFQLISVVVWTHVTSEPTVGVITLVAAMHELLQTLFLAWWSQYALRVFGSVRGGGEFDRFCRTENAVLLGSIAVQCVAALLILRLSIAPDANAALTVSVIGYVITRSFNLYIAERARAAHEVGIYSVQQVMGPALGFLIGLVLIRHFGDAPQWPIAGYAVAQGLALLVVLPALRAGWAVGPVDRTVVRDALRYGVPLIVSGGFAWITLNAARFIVTHMHGLAAAGLFAVGYGLGQRAATFAAMLVTASAFPLAVRQMERGGSKLAMRQLSDNGALLAAILFPSVGGIFILRHEIVALIIAAPFQAATLAILPLSMLAGAVRNFRAHFGDQTFLLHKRTRLIVVINGIEALVAVAASLVLIAKWGAVGGAIAAVAATAIAAIISFAIGLSIFGLRPPFGHLARVSLATLAMMAALLPLSPVAGAAALALHIALGGLVYVAVLAALYAPTLRKLWRARALSGA